VSTAGAGTTSNTVRRSGSGGTRDGADPDIEVADPRRRFKKEPFDWPGGALGREDFTRGRYLHAGNDDEP
jgi:hypothetical protein